MAVGLDVPELEFPALLERVGRVWDPMRAPSHVVIARTRAGKTTLIRRGLVERLCPLERVLVLDLVGTDPAWAGFGQRVASFPESPPVAGPGGAWFRLVPPSLDPSAAREVIGDALDCVWQEGHWIVVVDEALAFTSPRDGLGLAGALETLLLRGGARGISVVIGAQAREWLPSTFSRQPAFTWIGQTTDTEQHGRLANLVGYDRKVLAPALGRLRRGEFLYVDQEGEERFLARTRPPDPAGR